MTRVDLIVWNLGHVACDRNTNTKGAFPILTMCVSLSNNTQLSFPQLAKPPFDSAFSKRNPNCYQNEPPS